MKRDCPDPIQFQQALNEGNQSLITHVANCAQCRDNQQIQSQLSTWQQLDGFREIVVSGNFNARLETRLVTEDWRVERWQSWDRLGDLLQIAGLALLACLLIWLPVPPPQQTALHQNHLDEHSRIAFKDTLSVGPIIKILQTHFLNYRRNLG